MVANEDVPAASNAAGRICSNSVTGAETAVVVISSSPAASLSRGFSLSFQHQPNSGSTQSVDSARLKRTNSLDSERLVPFNRETSQHFPAEKRSPSPRSKQNPLTTESSLASNSFERVTATAVSVAPPERPLAAGCSSSCVNDSTDSATKAAQDNVIVSYHMRDSLRFSAGNRKPGEEHKEQRKACSTTNQGDTETESAVPRALQNSPSLATDWLQRAATKQQAMADVDSETPGALLCQNVVKGNVTGNVTARTAAFSDVRGGGRERALLGTIHNGGSKRTYISPRGGAVCNIVIKDLQMSCQGAETTGGSGFQAIGNATQPQNSKSEKANEFERTSSSDDHKRKGRDYTQQTLQELYKARANPITISMEAMEDMKQERGREGSGSGANSTRSLLTQ